MAHRIVYLAQHLSWINNKKRHFVRIFNVSKRTGRHFVFIIEWDLTRWKIFLEMHFFGPKYFPFFREILFEFSSWQLEFDSEIFSFFAGNFFKEKKKRQQCQVRMKSKHWKCQIDWRRQSFRVHHMSVK